MPKFLVLEVSAEYDRLDNQKIVGGPRSTLEMYSWTISAADGYMQMKQILLAG